MTGYDIMKKVPHFLSRITNTSNNYNEWDVCRGCPPTGIHKATRTNRTINSEVLCKFVLVSAVTATATGTGPLIIRPNIRRPARPIVLHSQPTMILLLAAGCDSSTRVLSVLYWAKRLSGAVCLIEQFMQYFPEFRR
ncbi:hypothetical protein JTB14_034094 [Gonioctena quinquepunctata]|nr:hypothetical protein JTB14_034094 [Gonioctena quinquepunctata]